MPSEGKSFVAANLAMSLARNSVNNILLIDGDLRRPTLHNLLGAPNALGLSEYLEGTRGIALTSCSATALQNAGNASVGSISNLTFIPSGKCSDNSSELVANHRIEELIAAASPYFNWIVIDSPPVLAVTDAVELARAADAVLLVARGASTPYDVAQRAQAAFGNSRILGFVLNAVKRCSRADRIATTTTTTTASPKAPTETKRQKDKRKTGMIRLFNVYYPTRTLVLLLCEALLVGGSFLLATAYLSGRIHTLL